MMEEEGYPLASVGPAVKVAVRVEDWREEAQECEGEAGRRQSPIRRVGGGS